MTGVIYARYSSDNQREESIEGQIRECEAYAKKNDIVIVNTYIDRAFSARTDNRPDFQKMIKDSANKKFSTVIVWKLDRFARDRYDSAHYKATLRKNGVKVVSATENISEGSEGILMEAVLEGMAEYYSAELSEKVIRGRTENALKCKFNGGTVTMGYTIDSQQRFQIDPITSPIILWAFKAYAEGASMKDVAAGMRERGMHSAWGGEIDINCVTRMFHNRRYIGEYRYHDIVHPNGIPAIVPIDLFERVQFRMKAVKKTPAHNKAEDEYLLSGKLFCGKCNGHLVGECGTSVNKNVYRYYKCINVKTHHGCDKKTVKKEWIENLVFQETERILMNSKLLNMMADRIIAIQGKNDALPLLRKRYAETQRGIDNMLNAIQMGIITSSTKERLEELEKQKNELSVQIIREETANPTLTKENVFQWFDRYRNLNYKRLDHRRRLINSFVNAVYLYDDKLIITFNYKFGSKTIPLSQLEKTDFCSDIQSCAPPKLKSTPCGCFLILSDQTE